jgi:hypothetical protein
MRDLPPDGDDIRRAVKWGSGRIQDDAGAEIKLLVREAIFKSDLSPRDTDFLIGFYSDAKNTRLTNPD